MEYEVKKVNKGLEKRLIQMAKIYMKNQGTISLEKEFFLSQFNQ